MRSYLTKGAERLIAGIRPTDFKDFGPSGIRAQLVDLKNSKLEMDFIIEGDTHSTHLLNAVSPAWTCAIPLASHVVSNSNTQ
jgi:L-2-hydroxyglutarate oxidase